MLKATRTIQCGRKMFHQGDAFCPPEDSITDEQVADLVKRGLLVEASDTPAAPAGDAAGHAPIWTMDPAVLEGMSVDALAAKVAEIDPNALEPQMSIEQLRALLSSQFSGESASPDESSDDTEPSDSALEEAQQLAQGEQG